MKQGRIGVRRLTHSGLLAALIALLTAYVKVPIPAGFAHMGDAAVILSGLLLGPYGVLPAAVGSALGDLMAGYQHYAVFSALIKGVMAWVAGKWMIPAERVSVRNVLALIVVFLWMVIAYFPVNALLYSLDMAYVSIPGNLAQAGIGLAISLLMLEMERIF